MRHKLKVIEFLQVENHPGCVISFLPCKNVWKKIISLCRYNNTFIQEFADFSLSVRFLLWMYFMGLKITSSVYKKNHPIPILQFFTGSSIKLTALDLYHALMFCDITSLNVFNLFKYRVATPNCGYKLLTFLLLLDSFN